MRRSVLDILDTVKFIFGNLGELQCWLATVAGLQLEPEHRRKTTFARSLQQGLAQAEAGAGQQSDRRVGLEEGLQYVIVTNAENPVWVFSFRWSGISTCHRPLPMWLLQGLGGGGEAAGAGAEAGRGPGPRHHRGGGQLHRRLPPLGLRPARPRGRRVCRGGWCQLGCSDLTSLSRSRWPRPSSRRWGSSCPGRGPTCRHHQDTGQTQC